MCVCVFGSDDGGGRKDDKRVGAVECVSTRLSAKECIEGSAVEVVEVQQSKHKTSGRYGIPQHVEDNLRSEHSKGSVRFNLGQDDVEPVVLDGNRVTLHQIESIVVSPLSRLDNTEGGFELTVGPVLQEGWSSQQNKGIDGWMEGRKGRQGNG